MPQGTPRVEAHVCVSRCHRDVRAKSESNGHPIELRARKRFGLSRPCRSESLLHRPRTSPRSPIRRVLRAAVPILHRPVNGAVRLRRTWYTLDQSPRGPVPFADRFRDPSPADAGRHRPMRPSAKWPGSGVGLFFATEAPRIRTTSSRFPARRDLEQLFTRSMAPS